MSTVRDRHRHNQRSNQRSGWSQNREPHREPSREPKRSPKPLPKILNTPVEIPFSLFRLPQGEEELTLAFQRAIGMAQGKVIDANKRGKGSVEVNGFEYPFEDNRSPEMQKKYPLFLFKDREIKFSFWPTYSEKAAKYRKITDPPKLKISHLRKTLELPNHVEVIGQVLMKDKDLFVISLYSQEQDKKYFVTVMGKYSGKQGDFIQLSGELKDGAVHYVNHHILKSVD